MLEVERIDAFYGRAHILQGLSFSIAGGEVLALLGRNGAGKTTTLKSIMQILRPKTGRVRFDGIDITGWAPHRVARRGLGYVPEERRIFAGLTVLENLEVGRQAPRVGTHRWTVEQLFDLFPNLAERRRARAGTLSGGEQQMLTIARTLMGNPRLVLLDEPSEGIAPVIVEQMAKTVRRLKAEGLTVVLSEQNLLFARAVADRALILERGEKAFEGSFAALDADPAIRNATLSA